MKIFIAALTTAILLAILVGVNSIILHKSISGLMEKAEAIPDKQENLMDYEELYQEFLSVQKFISLTVSHNDLTEIEDTLAEIIGSAKAGDEENITIAKSRLQRSLSHLRRLSGVNIDSIL